MEKPKSTEKNSTSDILRFAHPFFTTTPIGERATIGDIGSRMTDFVKTQLEQIPPPKRPPLMILPEIIGDQGVADVLASGVMHFHAVGDTGTESGKMQQLVSDAMSKDYDISNPGASPSFFFHLGDVIYYDNTDKGYHAQFYEPYKTYPGKIIAIPGNHDGELFKWDKTSVGQKFTLEAFQNNFCQDKPGIPSAAGTIYREMISQPGVYWHLDSPFADIIGLYSNMAENPGYISGPTIHDEQKKWLTDTLVKISNARKTGNRKALFIATHHPPFSKGSHSGSTEMLIDIDDSCVQAQIMPDIFLAAHAHSYQSYTRHVTFQGKELQIPFLVCGTGGRQVQPVSIPDTTKVKDATSLPSYHTFDKALSEYGYLKISVSMAEIDINFFQVENTGSKTLFHQIKVNL